MSDQKSNMPDFKEITAIAERLFTSFKKNVNQLICDVVAKLPKSEDNNTVQPPKAAEVKIKVVEKPAEQVETPAPQVAEENVKKDADKPE